MFSFLSACDLDFTETRILNFSRSSFSQREALRQSTGRARVCVSGYRWGEMDDVSDGVAAREAAAGMMRCAYEIAREKRIRENHAELARLGLVQAKQPSLSMPSSCSSAERKRTHVAETEARCSCSANAQISQNCRQRPPKVPSLWMIISSPLLCPTRLAVLVKSCESWRLKIRA